MIHTIKMMDKYGYILSHDIKRRAEVLLRSFRRSFPSGLLAYIFSRRSNATISTSPPQATLSYILSCSLIANITDQKIWPHPFHITHPNPHIQTPKPFPTFFPPFLPPGIFTFRAYLHLSTLPPFHFAFPLSPFHPFTFLCHLCTFLFHFSTFLFYLSTFLFSNIVHDSFTIASR